VEALGDFVGAVDIEVDVADLVQRLDFEVAGFKQFRRFPRTRNDTVDAIPYVREQVDKMPDGRSGSDAERRAGLDECEGCLGGTAFFCVCAHR